MQPEKALQRRILLSVDAPDCLIFESPTGVGYAGSLGKLLCPGCRSVAARHRLAYGLSPGAPDLIGWVAGQPILAEVKTPEGRLSEDQRRWHSVARERAGVEVFTWRDVDTAVRDVDMLRRRTKCQ